MTKRSGIGVDPKIFKLASVLVLILALSSGLDQSNAKASPSILRHDAGTSTGFSWFDAETPPPLPSNEFWALVRTTRDRLASLPEQPAYAACQACLELAGRWEEVGSIQLPDGSSLPIDSSYLVAELRQDPPALDRLTADLSALLDAQDSWPRRDYSPGERGGIAEILRRPEFQWQEAGGPSPFQAFLDNLYRRLLAFLDRLLGNPALKQATPLLRVVIIALGGLALLLVLFYALRSLRTSIAGEAELDLTGPSSETDLTVELALKRAQQMSAGGDYRQAVRYLYLSALLALEERGLLRYDRARTNREYLRSVANLPELSAELGDVVEVFDRVWYGYQRIDQPAFEDYAARVADLRGLK